MPRSTYQEFYIVAGCGELLSTFTTSDEDMPFDSMIEWKSRSL